MNQFTIRDIENLSGIKAHTWRIWEQRYGLGVPQRKDSNHRFYDNENLKQILRISYLYHRGFKISKIASLNREQIRTKALESLQVENDFEYYVKELIEAAIDLDEERFEITFDEAIRRTGIEAGMLHIIYPFQHKIGVLWLTDHLIPAQEHFTSNIIRQKLSFAIDGLPLVKETNKKEILLFTPENEHHEMPLQFIHFLLKRNNYKVIYFGSNVSLDSIDMYCQHQTFDYLFFHLVTNLTNKPANEYAKEVCNRFPRCEVYMSGIMAQEVTDIPGNMHLLQSMDEILRYTNR
jgi:DNA-binding transcriptional MerR regulator